MAAAKAAAEVMWVNTINNWLNKDAEPMDDWKLGVR
jgi:hypothetical protein